MIECVESPPGEAVTIDPPASGWASLIARESDARAQRFREQLGIPTTDAVLMTGHQADWWHPGVLAKYLALDAAARSIGAAPVWVWVDQDANDPSVLRYPGRAARNARADREAPVGVVEALWRMDPAARAASETPTGMRPAIAPTDPPEDAHAGVRQSALERVGAALGAHAAAPSLARQMAGAIADLGAELLSPATQVFATRMIETDLFGEVLERVRKDPAACVEAYNAAVRDHPDAGLRPLANRGGRVELPLWRVRRGEPRLPVFSHGLESVPREELAPRGPLMSGLMRVGGCELFVHGTGGRAYAPATERWLGDWLGETLAPIATVSATRTLPLASGPIPSERETAEAKVHAHRAMHNPWVIEDDAHARAKRDRLERIRTMRLAGEDPQSEFLAMHDDLAAYRRAHEDELSALDAEARRLDALSASRALLADRTWAFPLFSDRALRELKAEVAGRFTESEARKIR